MAINGINIDAATAQNKRNKTVSNSKSTEISFEDRTKPDVAQVTQRGSCSEDDKPTVPVSATTKATVVPTFKLTISGQVI